MEVKFEPTPYPTWLPTEPDLDGTTLRIFYNLTINWQNKWYDINNRLNREWRDRMRMRRCRWRNRFLAEPSVSGTWIAVADVAEAMATHTRLPIEDAPRAQTRIWDELIDALCSGVGEEPDRYVRGSRGGVLLLNPSAGFRTMTAHRFYVLLRTGHLTSVLDGSRLHLYAHTDLLLAWHRSGYIRFTTAMLPERGNGSLEIRPAHGRGASSETGRIERVSAGAPDAAPEPRGNPNKRGPQGVKRSAAAAAMIEAVRSGEIKFTELLRMKQEALSRFYPAKRTTLVAARTIALESLRNSYNKTPAKDK